jgi:NAD(P)-dependent dehydrogenase (short-subunit alcohol dehydrogenase family)
VRTQAFVTTPGKIEGVALVTGGTGGLGRAVVSELLDAGATVVTTWMVDREREAIEGELGAHERLHLVEANLLEDGAQVAVDAAAEHGPLVALVNLVGGFSQGGPWHEGSPEELEKMLALNLTTAVNACRAAAPAMIAGSGGAIVCVGTRAALEPFGGGGAYAVSKAAVLALVRSLDADYRDEGIRANAIIPSVIDTPANRESMPDADFESWVQPAEIARVIRFLCSDDSSPISGAEIPVYGRA